MLEGTNLLSARLCFRSGWWPGEIRALAAAGPPGPDADTAITCHAAARSATVLEQLNGSPAAISRSLDGVRACDRVNTSVHRAVLT